MRILLAEDDRRMSVLLQRGLSEEGHVVDQADTGQQALDVARGAEFDVMVFDVMLPDGEGFDVVRTLRAAGDRTPVLMLTARDANADVVKGLTAGADDYLTKPFSFDVLLARVQALARRGPTVHDVLLGVADLRLNPATRTVTRSGVAIDLTRTEFGLLEYLMRRSGRVVPRRALIDGVWGAARDVEDNTLDAFVKLLRQKVDGKRGPPLIHTARGVGYCIRAEP
ncbi:MAG TPA: response regulator transcription factor [Vicinamibacterales bacterium]|nr:response regulator transcription factor [Vicinamibacterales bacterium]